MKKVLLTLVGISCFCFVALSQTVAFHEDFELPSGADSTLSASNTSNVWAINPVYSLQGARSIHCSVQPGDTTTLTTSSFSTVGNLFVMLEFDQICKIDFFDYAEIFLSINNGISWTKLTSAEYLGSGAFGTIADRFASTSYMDWDGPNNGTPPTNAWWKNEQFNISGLAGNQANVKIRFRLYDAGALGGQGAYGWLIDNLKVTVNPDELIPPVISLSSPVLPDTVYNTGPFQVFAQITDFSGVDTAVLVYTANGGNPDTVGMQLQSGNIYTGDIPSHTYNTILCYHIVAWDVSTNANMGRYPQSGCVSFKVKQAPSIVTIGTGTMSSASAGPVYISSASSTYLYSNHISLFTPAEINASGIIESVAWNKSTTYGYNLGNATFKIYLKHTALNSIPSTTGTFASELAGATLVYQSTQQNLPLSAGWFTLMCNTANNFNYNGSDNLMVLVDWYRPGNATGAVNFYYTSSTGKSQTWSASVTPPNIAYGAGLRPNIQLGFQVTNYLYDIGISQVVEPSGTAIAGSNPVRVFLKNYGTDTITKATIQYTFNGQPRPPTMWTGTILPYLSSNSITLGYETMVPGSYAVKAWSALPNDSTDQNPQNDTANSSGFVCLGILNGSYTVGNSPTADFTTIGDALLAISQCGMSGPVVFNLLPGVHQTQLTFQNIPSASLTNTITFRSSTLNPDDVVIKYNATGSADNFVLKLDGAKFLRFEYITFKAENSTYGNVVSIGNGSINNIFKGNKIIGPQVAVSSTNVCLVYSTSGTTSNDSNNVFRLNSFQFGSYGFYYLGVGTSTLEKGTLIDSNSFINQYYRAIDLRYQEAPVISCNHIFSQTEAIHGTTTTYYHGMYLNYCQNEMQVVKNYINAPLGTYGVYMATCTALAGREATISNNMIAEIGGFTFVYGFYLSGANYQNYYHNSVNITSPTSNAGHAFYLASGTSIVLLNNIFANTGGAFCVRINAPTAIIRSNYNNLYSVAAANWGYWNGTISNLAMWKSASGVDTNSVSINPGFTSSTNLHVSSIPMNNLGTPLPAVPDDFDWQTRSLTTPDMGADEYTPPAKDILFTNVLWPRSSCALGSLEEFELLIRNNGYNPVTTFTATYQINNLPPVTETFNQLIPPLTTDTLRFLTKANLSAKGLYTITFYTSLPLDENLFNDTISDYEIFNSHDFYAADYYTSFEMNDPVIGPYSYHDVNNDNSYWHFFGSTANSRTGMIYMGYECNQSNAGNDWFFSRCFTFEANRTYELSFWYKTSDATYAQGVDVKLGSATSIASMNTLLVSLPGFTNAVYQKATVTFSVPATGVYYLGFFAYSAAVATTAQIMACIDDMTIRLIPPFDAGVLSVTEPEQGCGLGNELVKVKIKNFGSANILSGLSASYKLSGQSQPVTENIPGILLSNDTLEFTFTTPVNLSTLQDTSFSMTAWTTLAGDTLASSKMNDTAKVVVKSFSLPYPPVVTNDTVLSGNAATLTAQSAHTVYWYDQPAAISSVGVGSSFTTPPLFATTTYYAETGIESPLTITSGTGTSGQYNIPFYGYYEYGWSAILMKYQQMGYIDSVGFDLSTTTANYPMPNQKIYMALVHDSVFATNVKPNPAALTQVYNGTVNYTGPGYQMIPLNTSFFYDPDYSLLVYYENQKGSTATGYPAFRYETSAQYQAMYRNQTGSFPNLDGTLTYSKPNFRVYMRMGTGCRSPRVPAVALVNLPAQDAGVSGVLSPMAYAQSGASVAVKVAVKNYGLDTLFQIPVSYSLNGQAPVSQLWNGLLLSGYTDTLTFPAVIIPAGFSVIKAWTGLVGDAVHLNDTISVNVVGANLQPLPFSDSFDSVTQFQPNVASYTNWELGIPSYGVLNNAHSAPNSWCTNLLGAYYINAEAILTTQMFDFSTAINPNMSFWLNYNTELGYDGMYLEYSTDNGVNWHVLGVANDTNGVNWYNTANLVSANEPAWSGNSGGWKHVSYNLNQFSGHAALKFRFIFKSNSSGNYEGICLDDFSVDIPQPSDAALNGLQSPIQNAPEGSSQPVVIKVKNMGSATLTGFNVYYAINQGTVQSMVWTGSLAPGGVAYVNMQPLLIPVGYYNLCAWVHATGDNVTSNDTLCFPLFGKPMLDAAAIQIVSPAGQQLQGQSVQIQVLIRNYGVDTLTTVPVGYRINNGTVVNGTYNGQLYPNATDTASFPAILITPGLHTFCAFTKLQNDFEPFNDTVCKMVYGKPLLDVSPVSLAAPTGAACNTSAMQVAVRLRNNGADTLNFSQHQCLVNVNSTASNPQVFNPITVTSGILPPNAEANVVITNNYNMSQPGVYTFTAGVVMSGDGDASNDNLAPVSIGGVAGISNFPVFENFENGYNTMLRMQPGQYAGLSVGAPAANGSQMGLHFQGGNPLGWIGEASGTNATTYQQAWTTNASHNASAVSCNINAAGITGLKLRFDLRQTFSTGSAFSWFRVKVNNQVIADQVGDSLFQPHTMDADPWLTRIFDLSQYAGTTFTLTLQASNHHPWQFAGTPGDNAYVDNIMLFVPAASDAGVSAIVQPATGNAAAGSQMPVEIVINNYGTATMTSCQVGYKIGNQSPVFETWTGSLAPNSSTQYTFTSQATALSGVFTIKAFTNLTGDLYQSNDTSSIIFLGIPLFSIPYSDDMEGTNYWVSEGNNASWQLGTPAGLAINYAYNGVNAWKTNLSGFYPNNAEEYLVSPFFDFSSVSGATLRFHHWTDMQANYDGAQVQYSLNSGQTWINLGYQMDPNGTNWYTHNINGVNCFSGSSGAYAASSYNLSFLDNHPTPVRFRFRFFSNSSVNNYDGWAIDNFSLGVPQVAVDGGVESIVSPSVATEKGATVTVQVKLKNYGTDPLTTIPVRYQVGNSLPVNQEIWTGTLAPGADVIYTFTTTYIGLVDDYTFRAFTEITGDPYHFNDTVTLQLQANPGALDAYARQIIFPKETWPAVCDSAKIVIENVGYQPITALTIKYYINMTEYDSYQWTGAIQPNDSLIFAFNQSYQVPHGAFSVRFTVDLTNDVNITNNLITKPISNCYSSIDEPEVGNLALFQNYPNPSDGSTTIPFFTGGEGLVRFFVADLSGRELISRTTIVKSGEHTIELYPHELSAGLYFYGIEFNGTRLVRKMIINN